MQIKETMQRYGYTPTSLAKKMGVYVSTVSRLMDGNPTVDKLDDMARWIGCSRWEFFRDEIEAAGWRLVPTTNDGALQVEQEVVDESTVVAPRTAEQPSATVMQAIVCPKCGCPIGISVSAYDKV